MKTFFSLILVAILVGGSIYLFLQKPAPPRYVDLIINDPKITEEDKSTEILFVGDIMLDRNIRRIIDAQGFKYIVSDIKKIFENKDLIIGNLEGTITENESISIKNNKILHFTFSTTTAKSLKELGFSGVSLANNHALDFYQAGFDETVSNLEINQIFTFGHPLNNQNLSAARAIKEENFCFVGFHSLYNSSTTNIVNEIMRLNSGCGLVIVMSHWGSEYEDFENEEQQKQAYDFIDAGADLIIGSHPHVIQPIEIYKNKAIFYSLGNFIFDQDFSLKTRQGIAVNLTINKTKINYEIIPIEMYKGKLYFPPEENFVEAKNILISKLPDDQGRELLQTNSFMLIR